MNINDILNGFSWREPTVKNRRTKDGLTAYTYNGTAEKLFYQNDADIIDIIEGCLLDNYLFCTNRGYFILKETYLNPNASIYTILFSKTSKQIFDMWEVMQTNRS